MKRKNPAQPGLFDAMECPLYFASEDAPVAPVQTGAPASECDCSACRGTVLQSVCERTGAHPDYPFTDASGAFNHCTLDGKPARVMGRGAPYATIEPVDIDAEPIRCCWDIVAEVMEHGGAFVREDDDTNA